MSKFRKIFQKYERWFLIGLVIFITAIFTITTQMTDVLQGGGQSARTDETAGAFSLLRNETVNVTWAEYERARSSYSISHFVPNNARPSDVWTHLVLLHAARREGITISVDDLANSLREFFTRSGAPGLFDDRPRYKQWARQPQLGGSAAVFEESWRERLMTERLRALYSASYEIAPPATQESMVGRYTSQNIVFARVSWVRLAASKFVEDARKALQAGDQDKDLKVFFEKDPAVKAEPTSFRSLPRYEVEFLLTVHKLLNPALKVNQDKKTDVIERLKTLFAKTWEGYEPKEPSINEMRDYFGYYTDRLLEVAGTTLDDVSPGDGEDPEKKDPEKDDEKKDDEKKDDEKKDDEKKDDEKKDDEKKDGEEKDGEEKDGEEKKDEDEPGKPKLTPEQEKTRYSRALEIVRPIIERELIVRSLYFKLLAEARKDPKKSLKDLFEQLQKHDDKENPVLGTEPGKGVIQLLISKEPLTMEQIEELAPHDTKMGINGRLRVTSLVPRVGSNQSLPAVSGRPETWGSSAHGREILRLVSMQKARRKTFDELDTEEKAELREDFYLPAMARERAKEALEEFKKSCESGKVAVAQFRSAAESPSLGGTVVEDEWITASPERLQSPDERALWPAEYAHMQDRHFLRRRLASILRDKKKHTAGSYLPVQVDAREEEDDKGAAYLVLLLERKRATAATMPVAEFYSFIQRVRRERRDREAKRWTAEFATLKSTFEMQFFGQMQNRIEDEEKEAERAKKNRGRRRP